MERISIAPRPHFRELAQELGFHFHTIDGEPYWDESAYYRFGLRELEERIEDPCQELHQMVMDLVPEILRSEEKLERLAIPAESWDYLRSTWAAGHPHLYGRMDLSYKGDGPAKLLELNYDTPTSLYESAYFQWHWLEDHLRAGTLPLHSDQWNTIQENLIEVFTALKSWIPEPLSFSSVRDSIEDRGTVDYLRDCAHQGGLQTQYLPIEDVGVDALGRYTDLQDQTLVALFKLYPWEDMLLEEFAEFLPSSGCLFLEPAWKAVLSNKGILPLLWERYCGHPNLLESHFEELAPGQSVPSPQPGWVWKPLHSREGANIYLCEEDGVQHSVDGPYTAGGEGHGWIRQKLAPLPRFETPYGPSHTLIGAWVVADRACGMGIREDSSLITKDSSRFLPHVIRD